MNHTRIAFVLASASLAGCFPGEERVDVFTEEEFALISQFGPLGNPPPSPTNRYADDPAAAAFGQRLFFEKAFSKALTVAGSGLGNVGDVGKVNCASCHDPVNFYTDTRSRPAKTSLGVNWTHRNTPSLVNSSYYEWGGWGGKDDVLWEQGANGPESSQNFAGNRLNFAHLIFRKYRADYDILFPVPLDPALDPAHPDAARFPDNGKPKASGASDGPWELMPAEDRDIINAVLANTGKAIEAYERRLISRNAPIDAYIAGDHDALTPAAKRGLKLFIGKAACVDCHSGHTFTDQKFHNTGVAQQTSENAAKIDTGRFDDLTRTLTNTFSGRGKFSDDKEAGEAKLAGVEATEDLKGVFRTKSLRHIAQTGPYMHNGGLQTLADVVWFYNEGGAADGFVGVKHPAMVPLYLTDQEVADLVEFLEHLTGEQIPEELTVDTSIPG